MFFLPSPYPDELWYSVLCRYHERSGNTAEIHSIMDLFGCRTHLPTIETPSYLNDILSGTGLDLDKIIFKNSTFSYFTRFLKVERKQYIFDRCCAVSFTPKVCGENRSFLKYCPVCAKKQLEDYGEPYWVAWAQIRELIVCPLHNVFLVNSDYSTCSGQTPVFFPLSNLKNEIRTNTDHLLFRLSNAMFQCWAATFSYTDCSYDVQIKLHLLENEYLSISGKLARHQQLMRDLIGFYGENLLQQLGISNFERLNHWITIILGGKPTSPLPLILLALFLNIEIDELLQHLPCKTMQQVWDERLLQLTSEKKSLREISVSLHSHYRTIIAACQRLEISPYWHCNGGGRFVGGYKNSSEYKKKRENLRSWWLELQRQHPNRANTHLKHLSENTENYDWLRKYDNEWLCLHSSQNIIKAVSSLNFNTLDQQNYEQVANCIDQKEHKGRPERVTPHSVALKCQIPIKRLKQMKKCMALIQRHGQTLDQFRISKIEWAIQQLEKEGLPLNKTNLSITAGVKSKEILRLQDQIKEIKEIFL